MTQAMTRPSVFRKANVRKSSLLHNRYLCRHATLRGGALRDDKKKGSQRKSSLRSRCRFFRAKEEISSLLARPVKKKDRGLQANESLDLDEDWRRCPSQQALPKRGAKTGVFVKPSF